MTLVGRRLTTAERAEGTERFLQDGFAVFDDLLSAAAAEHLSSLCRRLHTRFGQLVAGADQTSEFHGGATRLLYNLHNKAAEFRELMFDQDVLDFGDVLLRLGSFRDEEPYQLALSQARGLVGPHEPQQLHIDSSLPGTGYPLVMQAMWVLDDFTLESGATRVVPGSHLQRRYAESGRVYGDERVLEAPRGSLILFDGSLWHGSSRKTSPGERWAIVNRYSRWFYRPSFDHTRNTPPEVFAELTDRQKELLGFRFVSPSDEFSRVTRMSAEFAPPSDYALPDPGAVLN